jgi:hypothetical protein
MRALADINRGRVTSVTHIQKHLGQHWPVDVLTDEVADPENATRAFLFAYKTLTNYIGQPYKPKGANIVACALKVRARIAHVRVFIEDTLDMVLYYPKERRLEIVDFQIQPIKPFDPLWPSASVITKHYLAERLKSRWDFDKLTLTTYRVGTKDYPPQSISLNESIYRVHWLEMIKVLDEMKEPAPKFLVEQQYSSPDRHAETCRLCSQLKQSVHEDESFTEIVRRSA